MGGPPVGGLSVRQLLAVQNKLVTKDYKKPRTWMDSLDKPLHFTSPHFTEFLDDFPHTFT
jgi:hypothetical protein